MNSQVDPVFAAVTAPGTLFEIGTRDGPDGSLRQFVNAASDLNLLIEAARRHGGKTFLVDTLASGEERRLTFDEVFAWRDRLALTLDIQRGDRVAICMRNCAEWMIAFLAVVKVGGVAALVNSRGSALELSAMIDDVAPAIVLADSARADLIRQGGYVGPLLDLTKPTDLADRSRKSAEPLADGETAAPTDPCTILFTSGTTGRVKGAVLTHRSLITGLMATQLSGVMVMHNLAKAHGVAVDTIIAGLPQATTLLVVPLFHISGLGSGFLSPLFAGTKVVIMRRWNADEAVRLIEHERVTMFSGVPTMLWDILHKAQVKDADLSSLSNIASGGQGLPVNLLDAVQAACPNAYIGTGYGMTECSGALAQAVGEDFMRRRTSTGRVLPIADVRVVDADGSVLAAEETGEIEVRGAIVMQGYWNRPQETAEAFTADGWLRTGDIGRIDDEGYVFIVDRKKDMVISGGENIYCAEVERVMGEIPGITELAAFGIPDERLGELLVAVVVAEGIDEAGIIDRVGEQLARYKAPARVVFSSDTLPRNHTGKVDKVALRKAWPELVGEHPSKGK